MNERRIRSNHLRRLSASKRMLYNRDQIGEITSVLVENPSSGKFSGYTDNYIKVLVEGGNQSMVNQFVRVKITEAMPEYVIAQPL